MWLPQGELDWSIGYQPDGNAATVLVRRTADPNEPFWLFTAAYGRPMKAR
jgi:hypothetical protein